MEMRRQHPASLIMRWIRSLPQLAGGGAAYLVAMDGGGRIFAIATVLLTAGLAVAFIGWWRFIYGVGDAEIVIESGLLHRKRRVIPFDRVQDISIERPPLARLFSAARVKIETGGSGSDEGSFDLIALEEAHALRDRVKNRRSDAPEAAEPLLFRLDLGRLLFSGLFNFSLLFLAILAAIFQNLLEFGLVDPDELVTRERADAAFRMVDLRLSLMIAVALLLLGLVSGVLRTLARDFGFTLTRTETGFRRRRGLFTLSEIVVPVHRIETAVISAGPVTGLLGWYSLSFQTLGADRKERGLQVVVPFARLSEMAPILASAGYPAPPPPEAFRRSPRRALWRRAGQFLLAAMVAALFVQVAGLGAGLAVGTFLLFALLAWARWRRRGYVVQSDHLFVRAGSISPRLSIIPIRKTQAIELAVGPVQRRLRLASLLVDTAGAPLVAAPAIVDMDRADAERLGPDLLDRFHEARALVRARRSPTVPRAGGAALA